MPRTPNPEPWTLNLNQEPEPSTPKLKPQTLNPSFETRPGPGATHDPADPGLGPGRVDEKIC
jgi:hypothetical protein